MRQQKPAVISPGVRRSFYLADLVAKVEDQDGNQLFIVAEASYTADERDTQRAISNAEFLTRFTGINAVAGQRQPQQRPRCPTAGGPRHRPMVPGSTRKTCTAIDLPIVRCDATCASISRRKGLCVPKPVGSSLRGAVHVSIHPETISVPDASGTSQLGLDTAIPTAGLAGVRLVHVQHYCASLPGLPLQSFLEPRTWRKVSERPRGRAPLSADPRDGSMSWVSEPVYDLLK